MISSPKNKKMSELVQCKPRKICKDGYILNPLTNICVKVNGAIGKRLLAAQSEADAVAVADRIPRAILLVIANMLPVEHRNPLRLVDKQFAADIAAYEPSKFARQNARFLMRKIKYDSFHEAEYMHVSRNESKSKRDTLMVKSFAETQGMVHIIRYYDSIHYTIIARYTDLDHDFDMNWSEVFKDTSPTDMVWLADMMENVWKVTYNVYEQYDTWNEWLHTRRRLQYIRT
jgi:hypothetical protein